MSLREATVYGRSHTEHFYPLVIYETFTLVPFRFLVPVLQIYMYLVLLDSFSNLVFRHLYFM